MIVYSSESGVYPIADDQNTMALDDQNYAFIVESHDTNEARCCTILFGGPNAQTNAEKWATTVLNDQREELCCGIGVIEALKRTFGVG